jgi:hypothetical protein
MPLRFEKPCAISISYDASQLFSLLKNQRNGIGELFCIPVIYGLHKIYGSYFPINTSFSE